MKNYSRKRFILRKEYFGGIILNPQTISYILLNPEEFFFMENLVERGSLSTEDLSAGLKEKVIIFQQKEIIKKNKEGRFLPSNIRLIESSSQPVNNCLSAPIKVYDTFTRKCNLCCKHCYASSEASFSEARRDIKQTEMIMRKFYDAGVMEWQFTGGEATTCPDFFEAVKIAKGFGMWVGLNSNACWSKEITNKILNSGINSLVISIEGKEEINDERRMPGTFKQVIKSLNAIADFNKKKPDKKIRIVLNMTVGQDNVSDVEFVVNMAAGYGFNVNFVPLKCSGRAKNNYNGKVLEGKEYMKFAERTQKLRERPEIKDSGIKVGLKHKDLFNLDYPDRSTMPYPFQYSECGSFSSEINIFPDGRIFACPFLMDNSRFTGPNMLDISVTEAWHGPLAKLFRGAEKTDCKNCRFYMRNCRGKCRAAVILNGGKIEDCKLIGEDPYCFADLMPR